MIINKEDYKVQIAKEILDVLSRSKLPPLGNFAPHVEISFFTNFRDVMMPDYLRALYPERMLIVLQHQFGNLKIFEDRFNVGLNFNGKCEYITIPFLAIRKFHDKILDYILIDRSTNTEQENVTKEPSNGNIISINQLRGE